MANRYPLPENTRIRFRNDQNCSTYRITGSPIGFGGSSLIYPAKKEGDTVPILSLLKEVYPANGCIREENGSIIGISDQDNQHLAETKERVRAEASSSAGLFNKIHEIIPIRGGVTDTVQISFEGEGFKEIDNTYAIMDSLEEKAVSIHSLFSESLSVPFEKSLVIAEGLLTILMKIHQEGWLHLDISDWNIFVSDETPNTRQKVYVIDFGCARQRVKKGNQFLPVVITDSLYSTPGFTAPEMDASESGEIILTEKADVYSVGCLLFKMLSGFEYVYLDESKQILSDSDLFMCGCPEYLYELVRQLLNDALHQTPECRSSVEEMIHKINEIAECRRKYEEKQYLQLFEYVAEKNLPVKTKNVLFQKKEYIDAIGSIEKALLQNGDEVNLSIYETVFYHLKNISLEQIIPAHDKWEETMSSLLCTGIAISNHLGKTEQAELLYKELEDLQKRPNSNTENPIFYGQSVNRRAVTFSDQFKYETALSLINDNIEDLEIFKRQAEKRHARLYHEHKDIKFLDLSRAYSAKGGYLALMKAFDTTTEDPLIYFSKAMESFGVEDTGNCDITRCHILHYAVDIGDKDLFVKTLDELLRDGADNLQERYVYLRDNNKDPHQIWAVIKGIRYFYGEELTEPLWQQILNDFDKTRGFFILNKVYEKVEYRLALIYRYLAEIEYSRNGLTPRMEELFEQSLVCCEYGKIDTGKEINILMCFTYVTEFIRYSLLGDTDANRRLCDQMRKHALDSGWKEMAAYLETHKTIKGLLTFEYC